MSTLLRASNVQPGTASGVSLRCPSCRQIGVFEPFTNVADGAQVAPNGALQYRFGSRRCPNRDCQSLAFVVLDNSGKLIKSYPAERIQFDATNIPQRIQSALEEAITCLSEGAHVASAIMIRRTLEELCEDKGASGSTLKDRIAALRSTVVLPNELFQAMDELRLLGNDAAHLEARTYDNIGRDEVLVALELTSEILKAVYQLQGLVKRLQALKK